MKFLLISALMGVSQVPTFSSGVDMVGITVTAVSVERATPVVDLEKDDFVVMQDGIKRPIMHFEKHDIPASVLILLDSSASVRRLLPNIKTAAARLIRSLRPGDEVQVAQFASQYLELTDFTTDHELAAAIPEEFVQDKDTALNRALTIAIRSLELRFPEDTERRRILILLSDGENTTGSFSEQSTLDHIRRSGVVCYVVHVVRVIPDEDARRFMEGIAYESGGRILSVSYDDPRQVEHAYHDIAGELGMQYQLGVRSSTDEPGWHAIGIILRRRSGVTIRHRRGYYVPLRR